MSAVTSFRLLSVTGKVQKLSVRELHVYVYNVSCLVGKTFKSEWNSSHGSIKGGRVSWMNWSTSASDSTRSCLTSSR